MQGTGAVIRETLGITDEEIKRLAAEVIAEKEKPTQAQLLIALAQDAELFHTPNGDCYATIPVGGHVETWPINAKGFRRWLVRRFYEAEGKPPGAQALQSTLGVLEAKAQFDGPEVPVFVRVAEANGKIYLDLCRGSWQAAEIDPTGWRVVDNPPVKFRRARGMLPLPVPERGGSLELLRRYVNPLLGDDEWVHLVAWLVASLHPAGPYPIFVLQGEQGSGKSLAARLLRALIDPNVAPLRTIPRDEWDLMIAARNGWVVAYDNLSGIPIWLSDAICRLSTGGGFGTRELYQDTDEVLIDAKRPVIINGIDDLVARDDLRDRSIIVTLPPITEDKRREEGEFWRAFEADRSRILGALLDAVSEALRRADSVRLDRLPAF